MFAILKIFFNDLDGTLAFKFLIGGFIGWGVTAILVPVIYVFWKRLPDENYPLI